MNKLKSGQRTWKPHIKLKNGQWVVFFNWANQRGEAHAREALNFVQKLNTQRYS